MNAYIKDLFDTLDKTLDGIDPIRDILPIFTAHKQSRSRVYFIGNGGSAGIASHNTVDFLKNGGMRTQSLLDPSVLTCLANDFGYEYVFSRQIEALADPGDLLVAISSSGNSKNIVNAIKAAKAIGVEVITMTGFREDNACRQLGDCNLHVPCMEYGIVETIHAMILQQIVDEMMKRDGAGMK